MTRGIITIATGDIHYYEIASNLLLSYRHFAKEPLPFAIIAEEENEYTELFDDVIITSEARHSFTDKFLLLKLCPFDETLFFDADSLAYGDLNEYWSFFENATDFSALGENFDLLDNNGAWYNLSGIGKYANLIDYKTRVHAGVMYIRNTEKLKKMYSDCMNLLQDFSFLHFHTAPYSVDECILGIAMPMNNMKAINERADLIAAYPCLIKLKANIYLNKLYYSTAWHRCINGILLHWGTSQTWQALYKFNIEGLNCLLENKKSILNDVKYKIGFRLLVLKIRDIPPKVNDIIKRIKK